jgi:hypothetical protein
VRCPLVNDILSTAYSVGLVDPNFAAKADAATADLMQQTGSDMKAIDDFRDMPHESHLAILRRFVEEQLGIAPSELATASIDFEKLFSLIEAELLGIHGLGRLIGSVGSGVSPADVLEMQFMLVLCGSIIAATRDLECDYHNAIANWLTPQDHIISFNYDLLIDRALRTRGDWFPDNGYGVTFHRLGARKYDDVVWRRPLRREASVVLLKPHGSLNWLYPRDSWETVFHRDLRGGKVRQGPNLLFCLDEIYPNFERDHPVYEWWERYDYKYRGYMYDLHSVIVPPTLSKPYRAFERLIGTVWAKMLLTLLKLTEELFLVGYSIRPDDARTWWLFRKVGAESESLKRIVVVDPSDAVYERACAAFGAARVERGPRTLESFANDLSRYP